MRCRRPMKILCSKPQQAALRSGGPYTDPEATCGTAGSAGATRWPARKASSAGCARLDRTVPDQPSRQFFEQMRRVAWAIEGPLPDAEDGTVPPGARTAKAAPSVSRRKKWSGRGVLWLECAWDVAYSAPRPWC